LHATLGVTPKSWIPPLYTFNGNSTAALQSQGYTWMSSITEQDPSPYSRTSPVWHFPAGASTQNVDTGAAVPATTTWSQVQTQLSSQGWSVVFMTADEFTSSTAGTGTVNTAQITQLNSLLSTAKASGNNLVLLSELSAPLGGPASNAICAGSKRQTRIMEKKAAKEVAYEIGRENAKSMISNEKRSSLVLPVEAIVAIAGVAIFSIGIAVGVLARSFQQRRINKMNN